MEKKHNIELGTLVEISCDDSLCDEEDQHNGLRLFVVQHTRDCDGTPLYSLSFTKCAESKLQSAKDAIEKLSSGLGASPEELNEIAEEEFELDSSFRNEKRACGDILSTLLLNASKVAGRTDEELIKLIIERSAITIKIGPIPGSYEAAMAAIRNFEGTSYFSVSGT